MKEFFQNTFIVVRGEIRDFFDFDFAWIHEIKKYVSDAHTEWKTLDTFGDHVSWIIDKIFELWILWILIIPMILLFAEIAATIQVILAVIYLNIWLLFLPFLLFFSILDLIEKSYSCYLMEPRFKNPTKLIKSLCYVIFLTGAFTINHYYGSEIENYLSGL